MLKVLKRQGVAGSAPVCCLVEHVAKKRYHPGTQREVGWTKEFLFLVRAPEDLSKYKIHLLIGPVTSPQMPCRPQWQGTVIENRGGRMVQIAVRLLWS